MCIWIIKGIVAILVKHKSHENWDFSSGFNQTFVLEDGNNLLLFSVNS